METFIRTLPTSYNSEFVRHHSGASHVVLVENYENDTSKYVFMFNDSGREGALTATITNYESLFLSYSLPHYTTQVIERMQSEFLKGFTVPANKGGPLSGKTLQVRDTEDRTNWLTSQVAYSAACQAGAGAVMGATFRTANNETIQCTYAQGVEALLEMAAWGAAIMNRCWVLKDAINSAPDAATLKSLIATIDSGWPSSPAA